ncbi:hypothetical protein BgiBS90_002500, partial [Biomphalaria glabrata]
MLGIKYFVTSRIVLLSLRRNKITAVCLCATALFVFGLSCPQTLLTEFSLRFSNNNTY